MSLENIKLGEHLGSLTQLFLYIAGIYGLFFWEKLIKKRSKPTKVNRINSSRELRIYYFCVIGYFFVSLYLLFSSGFLKGGHWYRTRALYMEETGILAVLLAYMVWGFRLLIVAYTFEFLEQKKIGLRVALTVIVSICLYEISFVGNRIVVLMFGVLGLFFIYRNFGLKRVLLLAIGLVPIALIMGIYQDARHLLSNTSPLLILSYLFQLLKNTDIFTSGLNAFEYLDTIVLFNLFQDVGQSIEPIFGSTFIRIFTWFIPRSVWANRALTITTQVGEVYLPGVPLVPLIFGEFHLNFSWLGPVIFPVLLFYLLRVERIISGQIGYNFYFDILFGFLLFRLPVSDMFISAIIALMIYKTLSIVGRYRFTLRQPVRGY
jgi:hypothetical protein